MLVQTLAAAVLCAFAARAILERGSRARFATVALAALALAVPWAAKAQEIAGHVRHPFHPTPGVMVHLYETLEYRPAAVSRDVWENLRQPSVDAGRAEFAAVSEGGGSVEILSRTPRDIRLRVSAARETDLVVRQFAFATWRATLDGEATAVLTTPESRIRVRVPAGSHGVRLELASHPNERIGGWISGVGLVVLLAGLLATRRGSYS
jgi:hypothetical protein